MLSGLAHTMQPAGATRCMLIGLACTLHLEMQGDQWSQLGSLVPKGFILWAFVHISHPAVAVAFADVSGNGTL